MNRAVWIAAVAGGLVGVAVGAGAQGTPTATETVTRTVAGIPETVTHTVTRAIRIRVKPKPEPKPAASTQRFSGNGARTFPVDLASPATLRWTNDGDIFEIFTDDAVPVNSQGHSGESYIDSGHTVMQVNAIGNWTIELVPEG